MQIENASLTLPSRPEPDQTRLSVVLPVFNELSILPRLTEALIENLQRTGSEFEIVYVNDGSSDGSDDLLDQIAKETPSVRVVHLARNFGQQAALQAGLSVASGDAVIVMDSDFQDDPAAISRFVERWREGFDVIYAVRVQRKENAVKRFLFRAFYRMLNRISRTPMPLDAGNFGLIDRRVVHTLLQLGETDRYFPGLRSWVGLRQTGVPVERLDRHDENPRVSFWGLVRLAKTAIFSFSTAPLSFFYFIAIVSCAVCFCLTGFALYHKLFSGDAIAGWTSGLMTASFFGALNAFGVAILGEYVVRIHDQVRGRPTFLIDRITSADLAESETNFDSLRFATPTSNAAADRPFPSGNNWR